MFTRKTGLMTVAANKSVDIGLQAVQRRLVVKADGKPGLMLMRDAVPQRDQSLVDANKPSSTVDELPGYIWDRGVGTAVKESPLKRDDHGMDAMRYAVAYVDLRRGSGMRVLEW